MQARTFQDIVAMSGFSMLLSYKYEKGILEITLELEEPEVEVTVYIPTDIVRVDDLSFLKNRSNYSFLKLEEIEEHLERVAMAFACRPATLDE